jgi:hypothetical protein
MTYWFVYTWHSHPAKSKNPWVTTIYFKDKGKALRFAASQRKAGYPLVEVVREIGWPKTHAEKHGMRKNAHKDSVGRDADNPRPGEVFEARTTGRRWRIVRADARNVVVEPAGQRTDRQLLWGRSNLKSMRFLRELERQAPPVVKTVEVSPPTKASPGQEEGGQKGFLASLFGSDENRDPSGRRRSRRAVGKVKVQSLIFQKKVWPLPSAKAWAKAHGFKVGKLDETRTQYRFRQSPPRGVVASKKFKRGLVATLARKK